MVLPELALKLLTIANITLEWQAIHDSLASRAQWLPTYDYIVVGGGTSGPVVASRLSENASVNVLLIEAGAQESVQSDIMALYNYNLFQSGYTENLYSFQTVPQTRANNQSFDLIRGRGLGGSSSINGLAVTRGVRNVYDLWAEHYGAKGWSYEEVLPFFMKAETQLDQKIMSKWKAYHGSDGPLYLPAVEPTQFDKIWLQTLEKAGYKIVDDIHSPEFGVKTAGMVQKSMRDGRRQSASMAYLEPNRNRKNLHILTNSFATKILFENSANPKQSTGVQFVRNNTYFNVSATKEIIVSCGAIASPQLLMLSGIGPKSHLESKGIKLVADLPVGDNYHEGVSKYFDAYSLNIDMDETQVLLNELNVNYLYEYYKHGSGPLTEYGLHTAAFSTIYNNISGWPDAGFKVSNKHFVDRTTLVEKFGIGLYILRPLSRGTIRLKSSDPFEHPLIDPNYYSNVADLNAMSGAYRELYRVAANSPFNRSVSDTFGCKQCEISGTDDCESFYRCLAVNGIASTNHLAGSCRMGAANDTNAVVDERLRVRGIDGLRVVDTSVMPQTIEPGTYLPTIMVGEKGAQMIVEDHRL